jgi:hypothetical protein
MRMGRRHDFIAVVLSDFLAWIVRAVLGGDKRYQR